MTPKILVVDRNQAFATVLEDMLEMDGGYEVQVAYSGREALRRLRGANFDLTILDMDLDPEEMDYRDLIQDMRQIRPTMRLVLIPLMGEDLSPGARQLDIQGTLSKPFFADDLLPSIAEALVQQVGQPIRQPSPASAPHRAQPPLATGPAADVHAVLLELARETNADAILLLSTTTGGENMVAHITTLDETSVKTLADLSADTVRAAGALAHFWGQSDVPFEHNMFESNSLRLYIMALPGNLLLVIVTPVSTPLGTIRHNLRRAAPKLAGPALT